MKKTFCLAVFSFVICACMFGSTIIAYAASLPTRFSAEGYASDYTVGAADWMWPVIGDRAHLLYVDPSVGYGSDDQGYADVGLGYRWINKKARLWGVYLFGGYSRIEQNAHLWVANPGIEAFGRRWDAHLNTYFVMGDRHYRIGTDQQIYFREHSEFSRTFYLFQSSGHGADVKFGYQPFANSALKGYLGSYFFEPKQSSPVCARAAGLEYWLDPHFNIFARYTYDHLRHHTGAIGLGLELGSTCSHRDQTACLEERLIDPVARYLAELGHGTAIPSKRYAGSLGSLQILNDHIAFFSRSGMPNNGGVGLDLTNCTFEKPCGPTDFTDQGVSTLNLLLPNTTMYFNGSLYSALNVKEGSSPATLLSGQSVWGRTVDYSQPPVHATERSVFKGWFALIDKNTVSDIVVMRPVSGGTFPGIGMLPNASDIQIVNSQIGSFVERDARPNVSISSENLNAMNTTLIDNIVVWARNTGISFGGPSLILNDSLINVGNILSSSTLAGIRTTQSNNSIIHLQDVQINMHSNSSSRLIGLQPSFPGSKILAKNIVIDLLAEASNAYAFAAVVGNQSTSLTLNESLILLNSPMGFAYIVGGNSLSSGFIEVNQGVLDMNARTTGIKMPGSGSKFYIDDLSSCFYNGAAGLC